MFIMHLLYLMLLDIVLYIKLYYQYSLVITNYI